MTKEIVETVLLHLPDEFELDVLFEPLYFIEDLLKVRPVSIDEVNEIMKKWKKQ